MDDLIKKQSRHALDGGWMIVFWVAMLVFAIHSSTHMVAAGDTWWAMACGRHFVNHGVDTVEPFSANSHKAGPTDEDLKEYPKLVTKLFSAETIRYWHPTGWINQNWLTHIIFYKLATTFGSQDEPFYDALVYWKFCIYIITVIAIYYSAKVLGVNPALSAVFACFAMYVGRSLIDIRPAGFSNVLVALYIFVIILATHKNILWLWLIVPMVVFWCNVHGGYLYAFIMLVPFVGLGLLTRMSKKWFVSIGIKGVCHGIAVGIVSFIAMVIFNPFHFTNLTHTFEISMSKHAEGWRSVREWHPAFDWDNLVGDPFPFLIMLIIAGVSLFTWLIILCLKPKVPAKKKLREKDNSDSNEYQWPKIDLTLIAIAGLTIFMAIRMRRFIPIAGFAACLVIAMLLDQSVRMTGSLVNYAKQKRLVVPAMPGVVQKSAIIFATGFVLIFGTWFGLEFKKIYIDAWPNDKEFHSIFIRMTASYLKPFYAGEFIKLNKIEGKMFNYWTEGGAIAYLQEPDADTGRTGLQLFMDGRAQAAYDYKTFQTWMYINSGGPTINEVKMRRRKFKTSDYIKIGIWVDKQLKNTTSGWL